MSAREDILSAIRARRRRQPAKPLPYNPPAPSADLLAQFCERATAANADVRVLDSQNDIPQAIAEILRARNLPAIVHIPDASLERFGSGLTVERTPPGPDDTALAIATFAIAETGTLAYPASAQAPASWHFRAGFEIAVLHAKHILPHLEDVMMRIELPHTLNLVTGPSRTGDIEQTLELGAHGPKALAILIVRD